MREKISPLNESEVAWVRAQLQSASKFVAGFSPEDSEQSLTLAALDRAFAAWVTSEPLDPDLINSIINYVGIAFGQALVDRIGFNWVIATDERGSDLAVYTASEQGDALVYPANFVAKRWTRHETNFLEKACNQIARDVRAASQKQYPSP